MGFRAEALKEIPLPARVMVHAYYSQALKFGIKVQSSILNCSSVE